MTDKRETKLWRALDWLRVLLAILFVILLGVAYFAVAYWQNIDPVWRGFLLNIIANLIPTFLLFVGAYFVLREVEELRSERDADELANKVVTRLTDLARTQLATSGENNNLHQPQIQFSESELKLHRQFEITNKFFDSKSKPQKLVIQFTNRGNNVIHIRKVSYSDTGLGLPKSVLSKSYRLDHNDHDILISQNTSEIIPAGQYVVELQLDGQWDISKMNGWAGKWGYLHIEFVYSDETINLQYSI